MWRKICYVKMMLIKVRRRSCLFLGCKVVNSLLQRTKQHRNRFHFSKLRHFDASCDLYQNFTLRIHVKCYFVITHCCILISAASDCHSPPPPHPDPETVRRADSQKRGAQNSPSLHKRSYQFGLWDPILRVQSTCSLHPGPASWFTVPTSSNLSARVFSTTCFLHTLGCKDTSPFLWLLSVSLPLDKEFN